MKYFLVFGAFLVVGCVNPVGDRYSPSPDRNPPPKPSPSPSGPGGAGGGSTTRGFVEELTVIQGNGGETTHTLLDWNDLGRELEVGDCTTRGDSVGGEEAFFVGHGFMNARACLDECETEAAFEFANNMKIQCQFIVKSAPKIALEND